MHTPRRHGGFSLLETILAISVILFGLVTLITLSSQSVRTSQVTSNQFIASQLAQEGIELVRARRDTNWLEEEDDRLNAPEWNDGLLYTLGSQQDYTATIVVDPDATAPLDFTADGLADTCVGASSQTYECARVWVHPKDFYMQAGEQVYPNFDPTLVERTPFRRLATLHPICRHISDELDEQVISTGLCDTQLGPLYEQVGIAAVVEVVWITEGEERSFSVEEHLYDWQ